MSCNFIPSIHFRISGESDFSPSDVLSIGLRKAFGVQALPNLPSVHPASGEKRRIEIAGLESASFLDPAIAPPAICFFPYVDADFGHGNGHSNTSKRVANE